MKDKGIKLEARTNEHPQDPSVDQDQRWVAEVLSQHLDNRVGDLDFNVTTKLAAARHRALAQMDDVAQDSMLDAPRWFARWFGWLSPWHVGVPAMFLVGLLGYKLLPEQPFSRTTIEAPAMVEIDTNPRLIENMRMLSSSDDLEFFQSLELLEWLDKNAV